MLSKEQTTLPPSDDIDDIEVTYMAIIVCQHCGRERQYNYVTNIQQLRRPGEEPPADLVRGVLTCLKCDKQTAFGMRNDAVDRYPAIEEVRITPKVPALVADMLTDARMCFYGAGWRGAVAMARAAVEEALEQKGYNQGGLEQQIDAAKAAGQLTDHEYMLAHGSRLAGNKALHREKSLDPSLVPAALAAALAVANYLNKQ